MSSLSKNALVVYEEQLQMVYRIAYTYLCSRTEAENAAQEVFVRLFRADVDLNDKAAVKAWLASAVTAHCLKKLNDPSYRIKDDPNPHEIDSTMASIMALPGKYKTVAYLFYYDGLTALETAELMGDEMEVTRTIIGKSRRMMSAQLGGELGDMTAAYDKIRIDANSAVRIWKNILTIQAAIDEMLKKQNSDELAPPPVFNTAPVAVPVEAEPEPEEPEDEYLDDEDDETEHVPAIFTALYGDDEEAEEEDAEAETVPEAEDVRIFVPKSAAKSEPVEPEPELSDNEEFIAPVEEPAEEAAEEIVEEAPNAEAAVGFEYVERETEPAESFDWEEITAEAEAQYAAEEEALEALPEEPQEQESPYIDAYDRVAERSERERKARPVRRTKTGKGGKKKKKSVVASVLIGAAIACAAAFALFMLFRGKMDSKPETKEPATAAPVATAAPAENVQASLPDIETAPVSNVSLSVPVETPPPAVYEGPQAAVEKVGNIQTALQEWQDYKNAERRAYFEKNLPSFTEFVEKDELFDGTEIVENGDETYSFIHWKYMEDWGNTTVSAVTGEEEPTLTQQFDYENSVTVEENEYKGYIAYMASQDNTFGDYNYSYGVKNETEGKKLEEIAAKHSLVLRMGDGESKGYGEVEDKKLAEELALKVGHGPVYTETPEIDYVTNYESGAFESMAEIRLEDGRRMYTLLCGTPYNEMVDALSANGIVVQDADKMTKRSYTTADGTELTISQSEDQAIAYAYLDDSYIVVDLSINAWRESPNFEDSEEERSAKRETNLKLDDAAVNFACDSINFSNIGD